MQPSTRNAKALNIACFQCYSFFDAFLSYIQLLLVPHSETVQASLNPAPPPFI